jgi:hypothetical protein
MSSLRILAIGLFLLACFAAAAEGPSTAVEDGADTWRQTRQGWQHGEDFLGPPIEYGRPALHPAVVGSLEVLLTMSAMLTFSDNRRTRAARIGDKVIKPE